MSETISKERILEVLGKDIEEHLEIHKLVKDDVAVFVLKPKRFLGKDVFADIAKNVKTLGGAYVKQDKAAGIEPHFTIPVETEGSPKEPSDAEIIKRLIAGIRQNCDRIEAHLK